MKLKKLQKNIKMEIGDTIICVSKSHLNTDLTIGKKYIITECFNSYDKSIFVINDSDKEVYYPKAIFNTISEYRQKQIHQV